MTMRIEQINQTGNRPCISRRIEINISGYAEKTKDGSRGHAARHLAGAFAFSIENKQSKLLFQLLNLFLFY